METERVCCHVCADTDCGKRCKEPEQCEKTDCSCGGFTGPVRRYVTIEEVEVWPHEKCDKPGYAVQYEQGYESWYPKDTFERYIQLTSDMTFSIALEYAKRGKKIARAGWNGKGMWVRLLAGNKYLTSPFLVIEYPAGSTPYPDGFCGPWGPSPTDVLAEDWRVVE